MQAVEASHQGGFLNAGQFCTAATRLFLHEDIYDDFMTKAVRRAKARYNA